MNQGYFPDMLLLSDSSRNQHQNPEETEEFDIQGNCFGPEL